jgi:hypothetical protein
MATSLAQAREDVHSAANQAIVWAESDEPASLREFEESLWFKLLALGRALVVLFLVRRTTRVRCAFYELDGMSLVLCGTFTNEVGTIFGKVCWTRPTGRRVGRLRRIADLPVDRELGLTGSFSLSVVDRICRLSTQMSFRTALEMFERVHGWAPSSRTQLRMVDGLGQLARPFIESCPAPEDDGEILMIQVDAGGSPTIDSRELKRRRRKRKPKPHSCSKRLERRGQRQANERPRRRKGDKSKNAKMAVVGVLYTLRRTDHGLEGPISKRMIATFTSHEELFMWLRQEADKRGYGSKPTYFLADGFRQIWRMQQEYFPEAVACLDWYHVVEKLWSAGKSVHREGSRQLAVWVAEQKKRLRYGELGELLNTLHEALDAIAKTGPGNKGKRKRLGDVIGYLEKNRERLLYARLRRRGIDIGSGVVEGAVRNLVRMRLDGPGRRWGRGRDELVLQLRCILLNDQWRTFIDYADAHGLKLPSKPIPALAHDAQKKAA